MLLLRPAAPDPLPPVPRSPIQRRVPELKRSFKPRLWRTSERWNQAAYRRSAATELLEPMRSRFTDGYAADGGAPVLPARRGARGLLTQAAFPLPKAFPQNLPRRPKSHVPTLRRR